MARVRKRSWINAKGERKTAWVVDWHDNAGNRQRRQFKKKRDADIFRIPIENQLLTGTYSSKAQSMTVKDLTALFLSHCEERIKRSEHMTEHSYRTYKGHVRNHITNPNYGIGTVLLCELTSAKINDFRDRLREQGTSVSTTRRILAMLRSALEFAKGRDLISINHARGIRVLGPRDEGSRKIAPPSMQNVKLLTTAASGDFKVAFKFAAMTGLRASEQHALRWEHLDLQKGEVRVEVRVDAYGNLGPPKSAAGVRAVPLNQTLVHDLRALRLRSAFSNNDDLVFPNARGKFMSHSNMSKRLFVPLFGALAKAYDLDSDNHPEPPKRFNWHALRHFAISCWIEAGLSPKTVQTFAGHSSLQVTMDRYCHLFPSEEFGAVMDKIDRSVFGE